MREEIKPQGRVKFTLTVINSETGETNVTELQCKNAILRRGREALAKCLAGPSEDLFISRMLFGDGGVSEGVPQVVNTERNGLFGTVRAAKGVISTIDTEVESQVIFTSVLTFDEANGYEISEMALRMNNGDLYSMVTFPPLSKTPSMQVTINWTISFV